MSTACASGMHFVAGRGCVPEVAAVAPATPPAAPPPAPPAASGDDTFQAADLIWQAKPTDRAVMRSADAKAYCANLGLADGGWRLPTKAELETLFHSNAAGTRERFYYWSWTLYGGGAAWAVNFDDASSYVVPVGSGGKVRCVR